MKEVREHFSLNVTWNSGDVFDDFKRIVREVVAAGKIMRVRIGLTVARWLCLAMFACTFPATLYLIVYDANFGFGKFLAIGAFGLICLLVFSVLDDLRDEVDEAVREAASPAPAPAQPAQEPSQQPTTNT